MISYPSGVGIGDPTLDHSNECEFAKDVIERAVVRLLPHEIDDALLCIPSVLHESILPRRDGYSPVELRRPGAIPAVYRGLKIESSQWESDVPSEIALRPAAR